MKLNAKRTVSTDNGFEKGQLIVIDTWYARYLSDVGCPLADYIESQRGIRGAFLFYCLHKSKFKGVMLYFVARTCDVLVTGCDTQGFWTLVCLKSVFGARSKLVVLEFIRGQTTRFPKRIILPLWLLVIKSATRRAIDVAIVSTSWEREHYAHMFGMGRDRFVHIPFFLGYENDILPDGSMKPTFVIASGRAVRDWHTLLAAAKGASWRLKIVYSKRDDLVFLLSRSLPNVQLYREIPKDEHTTLLREASVCVIPLFETYGSAGQAMLGEAYRNGVPTIVTGVKTMQEYAYHGKTALVIPPRDHHALREAVDRLMTDKDLRCRLRESAFAESRKYTRGQYLRRIARIIELAASPQ